MSLATRLSGFFLASLAVVLGGFSVTLYLLARSHFQRDLDERLVMALEVLSAAADVEPGKVEWEPAARPMVLSASSQELPVRWIVSDGRAKVLEHSWNGLDDQDLQAILGLSPEIGHIHGSFVDRGGRHWRLAVRCIQSGSSSFIPLDRHEHRESIARGRNPGLTTSSREGTSSLILAAGVASEPMEASLWNVALTLAGVSCGIWALAALVGRRLCNRALLPVTRMATAACAMTTVDRDHRLPSPATGDELDALANSFNGLLDRLQGEFERQKRFTGDASHQLRTPLTALLGQLEVARRRERGVGEYQRVLDDVHGEAIKLRQIVDALLFMARAETEAGRPDLQSVELVSWFREHLLEWTSHPRSTDLREEIEVDAPAWVRVHPPLLGQLLDNLLENACKYGAPGTPIVVRLCREREMVALTVQDRGDGLMADDLSHVFEPFFRSAEARRRGHAGVGLGLAIVQRIAAVFGGTISAESVPGQGSRFVLRLPEATESIPALGRIEPAVATSRARTCDT
jgi:signal transduction histidine kinase